MTISACDISEAEHLDTDHDSTSPHADTTVPVPSNTPELARRPQILLAREVLWTGKAIACFYTSDHWELESNKYHDGITQFFQLGGPRSTLKTAPGGLWGLCGNGSPGLRPCWADGAFFPCTQTEEDGPQHSPSSWICVHTLEIPERRHREPYICYCEHSSPVQPWV